VQAREGAPQRPACRRLKRNGQLDLDPRRPAFHVRAAPSVGEHVDMEERLATDGEHERAALDDALAGSHVGQHVGEIGTQLGWTMRHA
jgi:hypothetical protein